MEQVGTRAEWTVVALRDVTLHRLTLHYMTLHEVTLLYTTWSDT